MQSRLQPYGLSILPPTKAHALTDVISAPRPAPPLLAPPLPSTAVFICWAIDRDSQTVSHPEVYSVLQTVPLPGAVVEQPDGGIAYGAGQQQQRGVGGHNYQPPGIARV